MPASGDLYANPAASQQMLDDAMFDVEAWLASEIATEFARAEGMAFVKGTGASQPLGFLSSPNATTADGVRPMGTLQTHRHRGGGRVSRRPIRRTSCSTWSSRCASRIARARCS